jgi:hypothetical protein
MKAYGGSRVIVPLILSHGTCWSWVINFAPLPLYQQERTLCTHWIGGCVVPRASLDDLEKRIISYLCWDLNPRLSSMCLIALPCMLSWLHNREGGVMYYFSHTNIFTSLYSVTHQNTVMFMHTKGQCLTLVYIHKSQRFCLYETWVANFSQQLLLKENVKVWCYKYFVFYLSLCQCNET